MVLIAKKHRRDVYMHLLQEGVMVVKKDVNLVKHQVVDVPNLEVMMLIRSLKSREYVTEVFNWQWAYYTLTSKGVKFLRRYLGLPEEVVPATMKKTSRRKEDGDEGYDKGESRGPRRYGDRTEGGDAAPSLGRGRGGFRGAPQAQAPETFE